MLVALLLLSSVGVLYIFQQIHPKRFLRSAKQKWPRLQRRAETEHSKPHDSQRIIAVDDGLQKSPRSRSQDITSNEIALPPIPPPHAPAHAPIRIIVAMTGATGSVLGVEILRILRRMNIETHLVISKWAAATLAYETDYTVKDLRALAHKTYSAMDVSAPISSGSFRTQGMVIVPCSMKTLSAVATGYGDDLITRAADVILKERRKLVVVARETPLNGIHLQNMTTITRNGGIVFPPVPAFYTKPQSVDDIVKQSVGRILDMFDLDTGDFKRWSGIS
ncbi:Nn.00g101330.m01.CDS01 [Neocucurbitaria sp. VM-36]